GNSSSYGAGGGSGGTIQLIANSIGGTGTLNVRGGNGGIINGGGGGGGRIEIDAQSGGDQLVLFTRGGCNAASTGCSSVYAGAGTVFYQDTKTLVVNSEGKTSRQTPWIAEDIANVVVESKGRLSGTGDMTAASSVLIKADGFLQNASSESITITTMALQVDGNITINSPGNLVSNAADSVSISGTVECATNRCETEFTTGSFTVAGTIRAGFINVTADSGTIDGLLNTDNRGYSPNQGPGAGAHCGTNIGASGGSHAGLGGGCNSSASSGVTLPYDDVFAPIDFGSGGGNQTAYGQTGGSGGGKIRLDVANSLTIDGTLSAVGGSGAGNSSSYGAGGGAGGSIYVTCNTVSGIGTLNVRGGNGGIIKAAGGAAGRIAIIPQNDNSNFTYELRGGCNAASSGCSSSYAGAGTYWDGLSQTLTVDAHGSSSLATPVVPVSISNLVLLNKAKVTLAGDYSVSDTVSIGEGCQLESESSPASWTLNTSNFDVFGTFRLRSNAVLTANNINVPTGGLIDGVGLSELLVNTDSLTVAGTVAVSTTDIVTVTASIFGSIDSSSKGNPANQGTGSGGSCGTNFGASGGGYGGTGGSCNTGNTAYGDPKQPFELGSGGGTQSAYGHTGGAGAGRVRIVASSDIDISGSVLAIGGSGNGNSSSYGAGGGSGGAIWLDAPSILGSGSVLARGGNGGIINGGGGSGGRIALYYTDQLSLGLTIRAQGGCKAASSGCSSVKAGGGTLYDSLLDQVTADQ
ncbi:MAG: hypothetical protein VX223_09345, partial [Myxococcota bacterium]|nr:hypothetical protein [Myxococcota bacterium]